MISRVNLRLIDMSKIDENARGTADIKPPVRSCIVCRKKKNKYDLIHITCDREGEVGIDTSGYRQGRGAYLCRDEDCIRKMRKVRALNRAFRRNIDEETYVKLEEELDKCFGDAWTRDEGGAGSKR